MNLFFINTDGTSNSGHSHHDEWIRRRVVVTSGEPKYRKALTRVMAGDKALVYANEIGVVAVGRVLDDEIINVTGDMTISPTESVEYHRRVMWELDLRENPITWDSLVRLLGQGPLHAVQQVWTEKENLLKLLATLQAAPTADRSEYVRKARELQRLGHIDRPTGTHSPRCIESQSTVFYRDPKVRAWTLQRAGGCCEMCMQQFPFLDEEQQPYFESHHIVPLAEGGADTPENTAALCPNCHRELHFGIERARKSQQLLTAIHRKEAEGNASISIC